ncbi:UPF0103/Mediator of ErbB2-driven cell motility (Memo-related) [Penicillium verhagenii]|nr:UPF0103/Mediator of ErbB2-driven cell motility (Memo-related) [Penicillium verhagenii]
MASRRAYHAGSWYSDSSRTLTGQLDGWLAQVPDTLENVGSLPVPGARVIIAPLFLFGALCSLCVQGTRPVEGQTHICYGSISSPFALDTGPPQVKSYFTPLSSDPLPLDVELITTLQNTQATKQNGSKVSFTTMTQSVDEEEHSIEMHLPLHPSTSKTTEEAFGALLAPYLADPQNAFVISSDFCHWGLRFRYTYYVPQAPTPGPELPLSSDTLPLPGQAHADILESIESASKGHSLRRGDRISSKEPAIHESISAFDLATMDAITTGSADTFLDIIERTGNTVCGRHPIGVIMAALEVVMADRPEGKQGLFHFLRYERSSDAVDVSDSSVSYVSAFAAL